MVSTAYGQDRATNGEPTVGWIERKMMKRGSIVCLRSETPAAAQRIFATAVVVFAVVASLSYVHAEPRRAPSNSTVLERLPASAATRELEPLRRALRNDPQDVRSALTLAQRYVEIGRSTSDPRFASYALATLAPWMRKARPPASVLVLEATALQNLHRFTEALGLLDRALAMEPDNSQAWLTKATLQQVQGNFSGAQASCKRLSRSGDLLIALTCRLSIDSLTGKLTPSYHVLRSAVGDLGRQREIDAWVMGQLAEMALRLADFTAAERHFRMALQLEPDDVYLRAAYADLLLLRGRNAATIELLSDSASHDVLLLRLAIAAHRAGVRESQQWTAMFDARRRATRPDDNPHLREHARFLLDVLDRPTDALALARRNWEFQREPADLRIYARAARAAASTADEQIVQHWIDQTGFEDRTLHAESLGLNL
jgi:tetratricopeptide (TPR) repeat protein